MAEEPKSVEDLLKQIAEFEKTIQGLTNNVNILKKKLEENRQKYGNDISKWPKEAK